MRYRSLRAPMYVMMTVLFARSLTFAQAHFAPGVANIRDYAVPEPGLYAPIYNYSYQTSNLTDNNGNQITQVLIGPPGGPSVPLNVNVDVKLYALAPMLVWVSHWNFLGAHYA